MVKIGLGEQYLVHYRLCREGDVYIFQHIKYFSDELQPNPPQLESIRNPTSRTLKIYQILN
jgi:hypothetical protein